ncbi:hypothetical protein B0T20DRAFT_407701 [Sordaria brevicollis]|uniref:Zn(2)-C6 fungal-type domain-containing protein n=1 Tax=Sordaria brevicollis TaxID=83679 RepID=A0AAE0PHH0_SORBR|nr:hypothetical protein B0T20DRAFT_407701 [Sordaria brevicollis]
MPCTNCHRNGRSCTIDELKSKSCTEILSRKVSCDGVDIDARLYHAMKETQPVEEEESKLIQEAMEIQSRLLRLREQKSHLLKRGEGALRSWHGGA